MTARLRSQDGLTLIELLVAMTVSIIVLGATMTIVIAMVNGADRNEQVNEAQNVARTYSDRLARQLRNLASPSIFTDPNNPDAALAQRPEAVDKATSYDFVFRVVDDVRPGGSLNQANVKRVRYCLDTSNPNVEVLYEQEQKWTDRSSYDPPALPSTSTCPAAGWTTSKQVVSSLTNRIDGQDRPVFLFNDTDTQKVTQVRTQIFIDTDPGRGAAETRLSSGVTLRNQNREPSASFTVTKVATGQLLLNGSDSADPEGMPLKYYWYVDPPTPLPDCTVTPRPSSCLAAQGVVVNATVSTPGSHTIVLLVKDPAGLASSATKTGISG